MTIDLNPISVLKVSKRLNNIQTVRLTQLTLGYQHGLLPANQHKFRNRKRRSILWLKGKGISLTKWHLTGREWEVLELAARGMPNRTIAHVLNITETTVKSHFTHAYLKLGAEGRAHAVTLAARNGLLQEAGIIAHEALFHWQTPSPLPVSPVPAIAPGMSGQQHGGKLSTLPV